MLIFWQLQSHRDWNRTFWSKIEIKSVLYFTRLSCSPSLRLHSISTLQSWWGPRRMLRWWAIAMAQWLDSWIIVFLKPNPCRVEPGSQQKSNMQLVMWSYGICIIKKWLFILIVDLILFVKFLWQLLSNKICNQLFPYFLWNCIILYSYLTSKYHD